MLIEKEGTESGVFSLTWMGKKTLIFKSMGVAPLMLEAAKEAWLERQKAFSELVGLHKSRNLNAEMSPAMIKAMNDFNDTVFVCSSVKAS